MATLAPAVTRALADATARWPNRSKASDGTWGDAAHVARCEKDPTRCEGHVMGNAVDITHDPAHGVDGNDLALLAITDPRTRYVIWNRLIWSRSTPKWIPYYVTSPTGALVPGHPHTTHVHVSVQPEQRNDARPWPWSPELAGTTPAPSSSSGSARPSGWLVGALIAGAAVVLGRRRR